MVGIIISGHGNFASGLGTAFKLIAGEADNTEYVDFEKSDSIETLKEKYYDALRNLKDCDRILGLADLAGGSPFKTLVEIKTEIKEEMEVIGGASLPMILEVIMGKDNVDSLEELTELAINSGKNGVVKYEFIAHEEIECEDGI